MKIASKIILLCLLLFVKDNTTSAQTISYCEFLSTERVIDSLDIQLKNKLDENWKAIEQVPGHYLQNDICFAFESYMPAFEKAKLSRPSEFEAHTLDCSKSFFNSNDYNEYTKLEFEIRNELLQCIDQGIHLQRIKDSINTRIQEVSFGMDTAILSGKMIHVFNKSFTCIVVDPTSKKVKIEFLLYPSVKPGENSFKTALDSLDNVFVLMNAGMYDKFLKPEGFFVSAGRKTKSLNMERRQDLNFYMDPSGVFYIDKQNKPNIMTREAFNEIKDSIHVKNATQSGPMLLIDGQFHPKFNANSSNLNIRNGVGITDSGKLVFIISNQPVNFYQFASVFKRFFSCKNALYLDGAISQMYAPATGRLEMGGTFGPMIAITKPPK